MQVKELIESNVIIRRIALPLFRLRLMAGYMLPRLGSSLRWLVESRETTNFTYELTPSNIAYLCEFVSLVTGLPACQIEDYVKEVENDQTLRNHVNEGLRGHRLAFKADPVMRLHKRIGWYALTRALKPKIVVETGIDKGLGSVVLCAALLRNRDEGLPGHYYGTDLNPSAGYLLSGPYAETGEILFGDSIESLRKLQGPIDLFINDSDHSAEYEAREYDEIENKLSQRAIVVGDNAHATDALLRFSRRTGRKFLFWREDPLDHWYPGGGIGFSWSTSESKAIPDSATSSKTT